MPDSGDPGQAPGEEQAHAASALDLGRERGLLDEAEAARGAADYATARARAAGAVSLLLARTGTEQDATWLELLDSAGRSSWFAQDARTAKLAWEKVLEVRSRTLPDGHPDQQRALQNLAVAMKTLGDLRGARAIEERVLEIRTKTLPDDHPELQAARQNLAVTISTLGDLRGASVLEERVLEVFSRTLPDDHPDLQLARQNHAVTISRLGDLEGARSLFEKVLRVASRTLPDDHPDLQRARRNLAMTIRKLGDLQGARALFEEALEVSERTQPDDHPDLQSARANLASTIQKLGDLQGARSLKEKVLEVSERTLPDDHPDLQTARLSLAVTIGALGDLQGARSLEEKVLEVSSRTLPDDHPDLQMARRSLAITIKALGDLQGARSLEEKVLEVRSRTLPDDHPDLQSARGSFALTIQQLGDLSGARALQEKVLEVLARRLPADHPDLLIARENLAVTTHLQGDLRAARALFEDVLEVRERTLRDDHPDLQLARGNLAATIRTLGDFQAARRLIERVLDVRVRTLPDDHPDLWWARLALAGTIASQSARSASGRGREGERSDGGREECAELVGSLCSSQSAAARAALLEGSSREAEERCARLSEGLDLGLSFAAGLGVFEPTPTLDEASFVLGETARGAALASARIRRLGAGSPEYAELLGDLRQASQELAALVQEGTTSAEFRATLARREALERELGSLAKEQFGAEGLVAELGLAELAEALDEREAMVAFHRYTCWTFEVEDELDPTGERAVLERSVPSLCALVLRPGETTGEAKRGSARLTRVELGAIEPIETAIRAWRASLGVALEARGVAASGMEQSAAGAHERGVELRRLVFDSLVPALAGAERVVVALDDVLHLVPLDALPAQEAGAPGKEALLGDRWRIETRVALSECLEQPAPVALGGLLVALGGVAYDGTVEQDPAAVMGVAALSRRAEGDAGILRGGAWSGGFADLPGTDLEAREIARHAREAFGPEQELALVSGSEASRERLIELAPRARWLHVATHGWFASESIRSWSDPEPIDVKSGLGSRRSGEEEVKGMSPMLLCGIALAGANLPENEFGRMPGLMTAEEIAALDLSKCELAVLSACDTHVGERRAGQGVASLQRALQMAGARSVITSLWKVPDEATRELMSDFYRRVWVEKEPKSRALWEAKRKLRNAQDEHGEPRHSIGDWAAWVLTGEPD